MNRREFAVGGALTVIFCSNFGCPCSAQTAQISNKRGCYISDSDFDIALSTVASEGAFFGDDKIIPKSGDADFDAALALTLFKVSELFEVSPGFAYYDDSEGMNAYASPKVRMNGADGTVLFGTQLFRMLRSQNDNPDLAIAAVCAHEFGHIIQFKHDLFDKVRAGQPTVKRPELQADFFAGYFAGARKRQKPDFPAAVFAATQYRFGDDHVDDSGHHGTSDERASAVIAGFEASFHQNKNIGDAIVESMNYVSTL